MQEADLFCVATFNVTTCERVFTNAFPDHPSLAYATWFFLSLVYVVGLATTVAVTFWP